MGVDYTLFDGHTSVEKLQGVSYYDLLHRGLEEFVATQKAYPQNQVTFFLSLDMDRLGLKEGETLDDDDPRWGINAFDISNVEFCQCKHGEPHFEDKVKGGQPQIFITIKGWQANLQEIASLAKKYRISFATEQGTDMYGKEYEKVILSFNDDVDTAVNFICLVADHILSVPRQGVPISTDVISCNTKQEAQKEFIKGLSLNKTAYAKGVLGFFSKKIFGK